MARPRHYDTAEEIQEAIDKYFSVCLIDEKPPTITGLAYDLGFESRQSFYKYETEGEFSYTIKRARLRIESQYEQNLSGTAATGSIFALKNFGWKDKTETELTGQGGTPLYPESIRVIHE